MPGSVPPPQLSQETVALVTQMVDELARRLASDPRAVASQADSPDAAHQSRRRALERLRLLTGVKQALRQLEDQAARTAAAGGAGYPEIGRAISISRQGARRRWPGLITASAPPAHPRPTPRSS
ncbi:hypothetical protein ABZ719_01060 [Streptomyces sp. NPDC006743]|uniref:hypothetical protein n=1 Tax=Streptomyces sp. NPDC006743 TaxID=3154480 RepID=UPI0034553928